MTDATSAYHGGLLARDTSSRVDASAGVSLQEATRHKHAPRKIRRMAANGRESTCTEEEFFAQPGPLVVLGEPGAGKSTLLDRFATDSGSELVRASNIGVRKPKIAIFPRKLLIDGVDEVAICDPGRSVTSVFEQIGDHKEANFVLACRTADWKSSTEERIREIWGKFPTIGKLIPLEPEEIGRIVRNELPDGKAREFLRYANRDGILEMLGNPQHLLMFIDAVRNGGWPSSKERLYRSACEMLVTEANKYHQEYRRPDHPSSENLLECAGFVFAQLMLSGSSRVRVRNGKGDALPVSRLAGGGMTEQLVRRCLGTRLFESTGEETYKPRHGTVAEYLAARWLSEAVKDKALTAMDIETVMCVDGMRVPGALRGLHAWFATHCASKCPQMADRFIKRDPYGFWCYGDRGELGDASAVKLLDSLTKTREENPFFYDREGRAFVGGWTDGRPALQKRIIGILGETTTNATLIALVADSIRGGEFVNKVENRLAEIVLDESFPVGTRRVCLGCLAGRMSNAEIDNMIKSLVKQGIDSLSVAVDGIRGHTRQVSADTIVDVLVVAGTQTHYLGMGQHGIEDKMTEAQLRGALEIVTRVIDEGKAHDVVEEARRWIVRFLGRLLEMGAAPDAQVIWDLLRKSSVGQQRESAWEIRSREYFKKHTAVRHSVQEKAMRSIGEIDPWARPWDIVRISPGLSLNEEDLAHHLNRLGKPEQRKQVDLWRDLVAIGLASGHDDVLQREFAKARKNPNLSDAVKEMEKAREASRAQGVSRATRPLSTETSQWRRQLAEERSRVASGEHIGLLMHAANACLGLDIVGGVEGDTCRERLLSFAGEDLVEPVIEGLMRASTNEKNYKTPRKLAESRARWEIDPYAAILGAHCHLQVADRKGLAHLGPKVTSAALAVQHLAFGWRQEETRQRIIDALEPIVYSGKRKKSEYIRAITEPMLDADEDGIAGVALLEDNEQLSDVAGPIALDWLERRADLKDAVFWALLATVEKRLGNGRAAKFVRARIPRGNDVDRASRDRMMAVAFALDFSRNLPALSRFAEEDRNHFWVLRYSLQQLRNRDLGSDWSVGQSRFMLAKFSRSWPNVKHPGGMLVGDQHPWLAAVFLQARIESLGIDPSPEAAAALGNLVKSAELDGYEDQVKAAHSKQGRLHYEKETRLFGLEQVRGVLLREAPANHRHLQKLVIERLEGLQERINGGDTSPADAYWDGATHKPEHQCRDRIKETLEAEFSRTGNFNIVAEALMPGRLRSDLLCTHKGTDPAISVPIEVKGQWHESLWTAASKQLGKYVKLFGAGKTGIYVVLWFEKNLTRVPRGMPRPESAQQLKKALDKQNADIHYNLETFVLDLSRRDTSAKRRQRPTARGRQAGDGHRLPVPSHKSPQQTPGMQPLRAQSADRSASTPVVASPPRATGKGN